MAYEQEQVARLPFARPMYRSRLHPKKEKARSTEETTSYSFAVRLAQTASFEEVC